MNMKIKAHFEFNGTYEIPGNLLFIFTNTTSNVYVSFNIIVAGLLFL